MTTATLSRPNRRPGSIGVPELVGQPPIVCDGSDAQDPSGLEDVYAFDGGSGQLRQLTSVPGVSDVAPVWSPTRDQIAFGRSSGGRTELVVLDVQQGDETTFPDSAGFACDWIIPSLIVYVGGRSADGVYVLNTSTRHVTQVVQAGPGTAFASLNWSAKGGLAVTRRVQTAPVERRDIVVFPPALVRTAAHSRRILSVHDSVPVTRVRAVCDSPAWSPDGTRLAFRTERWSSDLPMPSRPATGTRSEIAIIEMATGEWTRVTNDTTLSELRRGTDSSPSFSRDGKYLAWLRGHDEDAFQIVFAETAAIFSHATIPGVATWTVANKNVPKHQYKSLDW